MTQTIRNTTITENHVSVDIYSHPNDSSASIEDSQTRYQYTCNAEQFTQDDLASWLRDSTDFDNELDVELLEKLIQLFKQTEGEPIYKCSATSGHDDYLEFFATKEEAVDDMESQDC
jgi:hypothetical protein